MGAFERNLVEWARKDAIERYEAHKGIRVGDFVKFGEVEYRVGYIWKDDLTIGFVPNENKQSVFLLTSLGSIGYRGPLMELHIRQPDNLRRRYIMSLEDINTDCYETRDAQFDYGISEKLTLTCRVFNLKP